MTSKAGYWLGGSLIVVGVVGAILWLVLSYGSTIGSVDTTLDDAQRVAIPGKKIVKLQAREYVIYLEGPGADGTTPDVDIVVLDRRTRTRVPIEPYDGSLTFSSETTVAAAKSTITPPRAGAYEVRTDSRAEPRLYELALGDSFDDELATFFGGALAIGGLLGGAGLTLVIVTGVRRSRRRK